MSQNDFINTENVENFMRKLSKLYIASCALLETRGSKDLTFEEIAKVSGVPVHIVRKWASQLEKYLENHPEEIFKD